MVGPQNAPDSPERIAKQRRLAPGTSTEHDGWQCFATLPLVRWEGPEAAHLVDPLSRKCTFDGLQGVVGMRHYGILPPNPGQVRAFSLCTGGAPWQALPSRRHFITKEDWRPPS